MCEMIQNNMYYSCGLIIFICCSLASCLEEGDPCVLSSSGKPSTCTSFLNCPSAHALLQKGQFPQPCGFAGSVPIVCCDDNANKIPTNPSKPTTTTTTKKPSSGSTYKNPYKTNTPGYKSFEKCVEYSNLVIIHEKPPILLIDKEEEEKDTCGFLVVPLIVGGEPAERREFPHMALVGYPSSDGIQWSCGGTLISPKYILTAGHCLISRDFGNATHVRMGVTNIKDDNHRQDIEISEIIKHPNYEPPSYYDDIGLLKLKKAAVFNEYVRPACLHLNWGKPRTRAVATGWGRTDFAAYTSDDLLKVTLDNIDVTTCNSSFKRVSTQRLERGIVDATQMCAGGPGKDTCQGDSGGPLQIYSDMECMYEVVGVTSFGKACGIGKSPGVYTRVLHYVDWIEKIVF